MYTAFVDFMMTGNSHTHGCDTSSSNVEEVCWSVITQRHWFVAKSRSFFEPFLGDAKVVISNVVNLKTTLR